jgi:hypothetical protein
MLCPRHVRRAEFLVAIWRGFAKNQVALLCEDEQLAADGDQAR